MSVTLKPWQKIAAVMAVLWVLTLGIHVGTSPSAFTVDGAKGVDFWDEFLDGKRKLHFYASIEYPQFQVGVPFLFYYGGTAIPASVDLAITTKQEHANSTLIIEQATLQYEDGKVQELINGGATRSGILSLYETPFESDRRAGQTMYRTYVAIPNCVWEKKDFTLTFSGFILSPNGREPFSGTAAIHYSENFYLYPGWFIVLMLL